MMIKLLNDLFLVLLFVTPLPPGGPGLRADHVQIRRDYCELRDFMEAVNKYSYHLTIKATNRDLEFI
jgi:hypothetical protein